MELHPQPQMTLWLCFPSLFEANVVTAMMSPLSVRMGRISSPLLLSFLSQRCEADGRTLHLGLPGKGWSCHHFLSAGLIEQPIFLRAEGLRWQFHYLKASNWQTSLSLNIAFCILSYGHSFAINLPLSRVLKMGSVYVKNWRFLHCCTHQRSLWSSKQYHCPCGHSLNGQWVL